jgi:thymidylate synthase
MPTYHMMDLRNDYVHLLNWLVREGNRVTSRDLATREVTGVTLEFVNGTTAMLPIGVRRGVNLRLAAVEALQLISGLHKDELIERAAPGFIDVLVDPNNPSYGAYGPRVAPQLMDVLGLLRADSTTRRAVVTIWEARDLTHYGDRPCTLTLQFLVRDERLELHVTMRSQDAWLGLTYDAFMFTQIQHTMAHQLGLVAGKYVHHVGSMHVYETDLPRVSELRTTVEPAPRLPYGVISTYGGVAPFFIAAQLLENITSGNDEDDFTTANAWYVEQIGKLYE